MTGRVSRRGVLVGAGALALGRPALAAASGMADLMPEFWGVYDRSAALSAPGRAEALSRDLFAPHRALFARAGIRKTDPDTVARWLAEIADIVPDMRRLHRRFAADYGAYVGRFTRAFPDFRKDAAPTILLPSLLRFDAHLEPSEGQLPLFFGLDGIVRYHGPGADLGVLFAHETFHCYQGQANPKAMLADHVPLYAGLWIEGGATWISERLNPGASPLNVLLDDKALLAATPAQVQAAARALLARFDSLDDADQAPFFDSGWKGPWPARMGYRIGLAASRNIGAAMSAERFARLPPEEMRLAYRREVEGLAGSS